MIPSCLEINYERIYPEVDPEKLGLDFLNRLYHRLHISNLSLVMTFYGSHRSGKSLSAVRIANAIDETFYDNLEKRVVFSSSDLLKAFEDLRNRNIKGGAVIVDEAGTGDLSSQRWYEEASKIVGAELQAIGYLNPAIFFVTQDFSFINKTARKLSHAILKVTRNSNKYCKIRFYWISTDPWLSSFVRKLPLFCLSRNDVASNIIKMDEIRLTLPPAELVKRYEEHSQRYKDMLLNKGIEEIHGIEYERIDRIRKRKEINVEEIVNKIIENVDKYQNLNKKNLSLNVALIKHDFGLSLVNARLVKNLAEKKIIEQNI